LRQRLWPLDLADVCADLAGGVEQMKGGHMHTYLKFLGHGLTDRSLLNPYPEPLVEGILQGMWADAQETWPALTLGPEEFFWYVGERLPDGDDLLGHLRLVRSSDIYLACACVLAVPGGIGEFAKHFDKTVDGALARFERQGLDVDDAKQKVLERLLIGRGERSPTLTLYGGHGALGGYVRITVVREVLAMIQKAKRMPEVGIDRAIEHLMADERDPELQALKNQYLGEFKTAFQEAFSTLGERERTTLRYYYVSGLNVRQIGKIYGVEHTTVSRRLVKIRGALLMGTRDRIQAAIGVGNTDFNSIARLVESQLNVSLVRLLGYPSDPSE
jgi:RNA polymerase sigma-70 factor (ECF subfamily)